ncbi:MAG: HU family DNA-binding protein [Proteobacteria bacterium]|nr:HU family DNA-binding protein [Pseudomonadota bacterium]
MSKPALITAISEAAGISKKDAGAVADVLGNAISSVVNETGRLMLPGLGTLKKVHKNARVARNPRTGEEIHVAARDAIVLKASKGN